jgi:hypothetical protein
MPEHIKLADGGRQSLDERKGLHRTLRYWAGDNPESEIWRLDFRLEIFSIGYVENSDARGVPGTTSQDTLARQFILVTIIVINVPVLAVVSAVDGLCPLGYVAGHVIDTVTIGLVL